MWRENLLALFLLTASLIINASSVRCPIRCTCTVTKVDCANRKLQKIPHDIPSTVTVLYLNNNYLYSIPSDAFHGLTKLKILHLNNNAIVKIEQNAFHGLKNLTDLYLTKNELTELDRDVFTDLISLQRLYLSQNDLTGIPDLFHCTGLIRFNIDNNKLTDAKFPASFINLTSISTIVLSNNQITKFQQDDVKSLKNGKIKRIDLSRCKITSVDISAFFMFPQLNSLTLSYNLFNVTALQNIINGLSQSKYLGYLGLAGLQINNIPTDLFANFSRVPLKTLDMSHSDVLFIYNGTFQCLVNMEYLYLSKCNLKDIRAGAFGGSEVKLRQLKLDYNYLQKVPKDLPPSLQVLDLSHNSISFLDGYQFDGLLNLMNLSLASCNINKVKSEAFTGLNSLISLDMSFNQFGGSNLGNKVLHPLINLKTLRLNGNSITQIPTQSKLFEKLSTLVELEIRDNSCTDLVPNLFSPLKSLRRLDLSGNQLGDYVATHGEELFSNLPTLEELRVENNYLYQLPARLFSHLVSLKNVRLANNRISQWPSDLFENNRHLRFVDLSQNKIAVINESSVQNLPNGTILVITKNPFSCWCDLIWFRQWIDTMTNTSRIHLPGNQSYQCHSPQGMVGTMVIKFKPESILQQCFPPPWRLIIASSVSGLVVLFFCSGLVIYRYRWNLRLKWYFTKKKLLAWRSQQYQSLEQCNEDNFNYDICVLYGPLEEDSCWVEEVLLPSIMEVNNGELNVFYEKRDCLPNEFNLGKICEAIYSSRKIIMVLTRSYLKNTRRKLEIQEAVTSYCRQNIETKQMLIPVICENGVDVRTPAILHSFMDEENKLEWREDPDSQTLFKNKLKDKLSANIPSV